MRATCFALAGIRVDRLLLGGRRDRQAQAAAQRRLLRAVQGPGRHDGPGRAELRQGGRPARADRGGHPGRARQARSLFQLHRPDELDRFRASVESEFGGIGIQIAHRRRAAADPQPAGRHARLSRRACWPATASSRSTARAPKASRSTRRSQRLKGEDGHQGHADGRPSRPSDKENVTRHARDDPRRDRAGRPPQGRRRAGTSCSTTTSGSATSASRPSAATRPRELRKALDATASARSCAG